MKQFSLPAELLKFSVFNNFVDLEGMSSFSRSRVGSQINSTDDKELLMSIEELEKKFSINLPIESQQIQSVTQSTTSSSSSHMKPQPPSSSQKFVRPDVTWLRRTEYISSVKNNPNGTSNPHISVDEAKAMLNEPVKFEEIINEVCATFTSVKDSKHPVKKSLELVQSFPIDLNYLSDNNALVHCLFLGDNLANDNSILKLSSETDAMSLFNPTDTQNTFKSAGEFDIQKSTAAESTGGKSFVIMLPANNNTDNHAGLAKINSNFSLRKRRAAGSKTVKKAKIIKVNRSG